MKDDDARPQSEMDVLKFYIWLMAVMTLALAGFFWKVWTDLDSVKKNRAFGEAQMNDKKDGFGKMQSEIQGMLGVYKSNKEDLARDSPLTWFSSAWRRVGIPDASMQSGAWKVPPDYNAKGKFAEERIEMSFSARNPLPRKQIAQFCHEIEKNSTRLRIIELEVRRTDKDNFEKDEWSGKCVVGFRHTPEKRD
jgi:hypothetical protein